MREVDYDIIIIGGGPAGLGFTNALGQIIDDPIKFLKQYSRWLPDRIYQTLIKTSIDPSLLLVKGPKPNNQFISIWDKPYDELAPFGFEVKDFAEHHTKLVEWELPRKRFRYQSPYCSINHVKFLDILEEKVRKFVEIRNTWVSTVHVEKDRILIQTTDKSLISASLVIDAGGYNSPFNEKYNLNTNSPIYQMLVWKFPKIEGFNRDMNTIWYKPKAMYSHNKYDLDDKVIGWFHPLGDGNIIGTAKFIYNPILWKQFIKDQTKYLKEYIRLREFKPEGNPQVFAGIIDLYNPNHYLPVRRVLQIGDARKRSRPATGYGFIPALWHSLYGAVATSIVWGKKDFSFRTLDYLTERLFNRKFLFNYTWDYILQMLFMDANWDLIDNVFQIVNEITEKMGPNWGTFFDRMTLCQFTRDDLTIGFRKFLLRFLKQPSLFNHLPKKDWWIFLKTLGINRLLHFNRKYD